MKHKITVTEINQALPQTQCGLCGYNGCKPYAKAISDQETTINKCQPGGVTGLLALAKITGDDPNPYLASMEKNQTAKMVAHIKEDECIGCTKCLVACPVDAILGAAKQMHTVIADECTGCELCVAPCPVDCIEMLVDENQPKHYLERAVHYKMRFDNRQQRLRQQKDNKQQQYQQRKNNYYYANNNSQTSLVTKKKAIIEAVNRETLRRKKLIEQNNQQATQE